MSLSRLKEMGYWNPRLDKLLPLLPEGAWIAGGFLRAMIAGEDDAMGDIDFFFGSSGAFDNTLQMIKRPTAETKSAFGYYSMTDYEEPIEKLRTIDFKNDLMVGRPAIQLVKLWWYNDPTHVIDQFDLSVCQLAIDKERIYFGPNTFEDIKAKTIRVHRNTGSALSLLNRLLKYKEKGYKVSTELFNQVETAAIEVLKDPKQINEYFYLDKDDTKTHKRLVSHLQRSWSYLEEAQPEAYKDMLKNRRRPAKKMMMAGVGVY
jgi:hypothetical protein